MAAAAPPPKAAAEYAKSNRVSCKSCGTAIAFGSLKLGLWTKGYRGFDIVEWHHLDCFATKDRPFKSAADEIKGFSSLKDCDQDALRKLEAAASVDEVLTGTLLKHLYGLLRNLSRNENLQQDVAGDAISMCVSYRGYITNIKYTDIIDLSNLLYEELHKQFVWILSGTSNLPSGEVLDKNGCLTSEEFLVLLRCSMIIVQFLEFDTTLVKERCQFMVTLLQKLCPPHSTPQFPYCFGRNVDLASQEAGKSANCFLAILEVFLDELLMTHHELRMHFILADCASAMKEKLPQSNCSLVGVHTILVIMSSHFLLSVYDESAFERFIDSLFWSNEVDNQIPALGLDSLLALLSYRVIYSAPHLLQAHIILLASRCVGIYMPTYSQKPNVQKINPYLLAFERSAKLYSGFMPFLNLSGSLSEDKSEPSLGAEGPSFTSCIRSLTDDNLRQQINRLIDFCSLPSYGLQSRTKKTISDNCIDYIKGNLNFIEETFREKACSILTCIVRRILPSENEMSYEDGEKVEQKIYCVSALLKLMSSSLLQISWFLSQSDHSGGMKTLKQISDFLSGIISSFGNYSKDQHIHKILFAANESNSGTQKDTKFMFSHFTSLLSYSFQRNIDFLWKSCIFMMISLMNLLIFYEGNLDAFQPSLWKINGHAFPHTSQAIILKDSAYKSSSIAIASSMKKLRNQFKCLQYTDHRMETPGGEPNKAIMFHTDELEKRIMPLNEADACNGESFLESLLGNQHSCEDLVDFIECTPGKDYSSWLERHATFRKWKHERISSIKCEVRRKRRRRS